MKITVVEIENIQNQWGKSVVEIGKAQTKGLDFKELAEKHVKRFYNYLNGDVLFKPTKASKMQFRNTVDGALSYFIGGNSSFSEDKGFALQPWTKVRFENSNIIILDDNKAMAMGNYFFTDLNGNETKVEYSFVYIKNKNNEIKIILHHSSIPFSTN